MRKMVPSDDPALTFAVQYRSHSAYCEVNLDQNFVRCYLILASSGSLFYVIYLRRNVMII